MPAAAMATPITTKPRAMTTLVTEDFMRATSLGNCKEVCQIKRVREAAGRGAIETGVVSIGYRVGFAVGGALLEPRARAGSPGMKWLQPLRRTHARETAAGPRQCTVRACAARS